MAREVITDEEVERERLQASEAHSNPQTGER